MTVYCRGDITTEFYQGDRVYQVDRILLKYKYILLVKLHCRNYDIDIYLPEKLFHLALFCLICQGDYDIILLIGRKSTG